jgi:hypothetical protein
MISVTPAMQAAAIAFFNIASPVSFPSCAPYSTGRPRYPATGETQPTLPATAILSFAQKNGRPVRRAGEYMG